MSLCYHCQFLASTSIAYYIQGILIGYLFADARAGLAQSENAEDVTEHPVKGGVRINSYLTYNWSVVHVCLCISCYACM